MKLVICTKFQVNRMNCVESRRGGPIDPPPSRLPVTIFSRRLQGLNDCKPTVSYKAIELLSVFPIGVITVTKTFVEIYYI